MELKVKISVSGPAGSGKSLLHRKLNILLNKYNFHPSSSNIERINANTEQIEYIGDGNIFKKPL